LKSVHDILRSKILLDKGVVETPKYDFLGLTRSEWSSVFEQHLTNTLTSYQFTSWPEYNQFITYMRNRLIIGAYKYDKMNQERGKYFNYVGNSIHRLSLYRRTGNQELLVDVANMALLEYVKGYGKEVLHLPIKGTGLEEAFDHLEQYSRTGNKTHLILTAFNCVMEFVKGQHPNAHFTVSEDRTELKEV